MTEVAIKKREIVDKAFASNRQRNVNVEVACIMKNGLAYSVKFATVKAAAHRLAIATAIGNPQSSNDLRLRFQRQNQATMHTARERLRCDRCDLLRLL